MIQFKQIQYFKYNLDKKFLVLLGEKLVKEKKEQAGAELCQAQFKLGPPNLTSIKKKIVPLLFACNAQGQQTHFALTVNI
jgi:hypothetical protein